MVETFATDFEGLTVELDDGVTTWRKNDATVVQSGEEAFGDVWLKGNYYNYEEDGEEVVVLDSDDNECYRFENSELGWDEFANSVLS